MVVEKCNHVAGPIDLRPAAKAAELEPSGANYYLLALAAVKNGDRNGALAAVKKASFT